MADLADSANDLRDRELEMRIAAARRQPAPAQVDVNECANECGDAPRQGSRYCCAECCAEDEHRNAIRRKQGLK